VDILTGLPSGTMVKSCVLVVTGGHARTNARAQARLHNAVEAGRRHVQTACEHAHDEICVFSRYADFLSRLVSKSSAAEPNAAAMTVGHDSGPFAAARERPFKDNGHVVIIGAGVFTRAA
jgi:hypothetical protein